MRTIILSREKTDYARPVSEFVEMFNRKYPGRDIEIVDLDTKDGANKATVYGISQFPAVVVSADDGRVIQIWQGETLPLIDEVAAFAIG